MDFNVVSILINVVLGVAVWGLKTAYSNLKDTLAEHGQAISHIRDSYFKKEDWLEFKKELWHKLDGMENRFEARIKEIKE